MRARVISLKLCGNMCIPVQEILCEKSTEFAVSGNSTTTIGQVLNRRLFAITSCLSRIFCKMPCAAQGAAIGSQFLWRAASSDLVRSGRHSFTFGRVFPLPGNRTFRFVAHYAPSE